LAYIYHVLLVISATVVMPFTLDIESILGSVCFEQFQHMFSTTGHGLSDLQPFFPVVAHSGADSRADAVADP
jgi:hypothetical protein